MKITESKIKLIIENVINELSLLNESGGFKGLNNNSQGIKSRDGSIGHRTGGEGSFRDIPSTFDLKNYTDLGKSPPEKIEKWKSINRKPSYMYYPNADKNKMWSHIGHLQSNKMYGNKIKFFGYNNGEYIFWEIGDSKGYLTPNSPVSEYK